MKLPNGCGSVHKLSGNRRNPWRVRITVGWSIDEDTGKAKQNYQTVGYYPTRVAALDALSEYRKNPYELTSKAITFAEVYEKWSVEHFTEICASAVRTWKSAYNHSQPLWNMKMRDIRAVHLEQTIREAKVGDDTKGRMKSLYNQMFRFAMKHEIINKDYATLCNPVKKTKPSKPKVPFTEDEIKILWDNINYSVVDMILIEIYSGWRPQELALLKTKDIDLENNTMFGGIKTDAGKNRYVPIHPKIRPLIEKRYDPKNEQLFNDFSCKEPKMTYDKYDQRFERTMEHLGLKHKPHETRHTFITRAKEVGVDEYCLKLIIGHQIGDVTERVYTHRTIENLQREIEKIP